jgi:hypothetical protein
MAPLPNRKRELFSHAIAAGEPLALAYTRAGYKEGYSARFNASRLRNMPEVKARITEILEASAQHSAISADYVRHRLLGLMEADPVDLYEPDPARPGRLRLRPLESLPESVRKSVTRLKIDAETGRPVEIILADKTQAASALLRSLPGAPARALRFL